MLFKNAKIYALTQPVDLSNIEDALQEFSFRPCGSQEISTIGWSAPLPLGKELSHQANGFFTLRLKRESRLLPSRVINRELAEKVEQIEAETGSPVGKKAQADLKQEIVARLLPQAFVDHAYTVGTIIPSENLVIVDASNFVAAEKFLAVLRKSIGSLPVVPLARRSLSSDLTHWLTKSSPEKIELLEEAELKSTDDLGSVIRCKKQPLDSEEITGHLDSGKMIEKLGVNFDEQFSCVISEDGSISKIKFTERMLEENDDIPKDQVAAKFDADVVLGVNSLIEFVKHLDEALKLVEQPVSVQPASDLNKDCPNPFFGADGKDVLYQDAVNHVKASRRASVSNVQRVFRIGYNRAARLIEQMEVDGVVSQPAHNGAREVLMPAA